MQADEAADAAARASLESIFIAPGNPLGTTVVEAKVCKCGVPMCRYSLRVHHCCDAQPKDIAPCFGHHAIFVARPGTYYSCFTGYADYQLWFGSWPQVSGNAGNVLTRAKLKRKVATAFLGSRSLQRGVGGYHDASVGLIYYTLKQSSLLFSRAREL